jgi:hypothetical protein
MKYCRRYLLTADNQIAKALVLKCADDDDAKRQCQEVFISADRFFGAEIWDGARRVYSFPDELAAIAASRRRKAEVRERDEAIAEALSAQIAHDRRRNLEADAVKAARLREQRLEKEAQSRDWASTSMAETRPGTTTPTLGSRWRQLREIAMADDKTKRAPQDGTLISLAEDEEIEFWTVKFGVSRERLAEAVEAVGHSAETIATYLDEHAVAHETR